ncbi:MAG TPA: DUF2946 family protein [Noviherbaspirillum sp.]
MDDIVRQAMAKWPNVPHCYGWLALDARGTWRMRDERAQALGLVGDPIRNTALTAFINRNYTHDEQGRWYFQNGPQRVYVNLEATPYIAHTDPEHGFVLHTGEALRVIEASWLTDTGQLLLQEGEKLALVDDRDMTQCLEMLRLHGEGAPDEAVMKWLEQPGDEEMRLAWKNGELPVAFIEREQLASRFGFVAQPAP